MDFLGFGGQKGPIRDFTVCSIRCVIVSVHRGRGLCVEPKLYLADSREVKLNFSFVAKIFFSPESCSHKE